MLESPGTGTVLIVTAHTRKNHTVVIMPNLDRIMVVKDATNEALADRAGVNPRTVCKARNGGALRRFYAECIAEALENNTFTRHNNGGRKAFV